MASIVFLDIRNFSAHRQVLARTRSAKPLTQLIKSLLEEAVDLSKRSVTNFHVEKYPLLNHTGDGFVLIFQEGDCCLAALAFASEFRFTVKKLIKRYTKAYEEWRSEQTEDIRQVAGLHYGMGVHCGSVTSFAYDSFRGKRRAFLGSAVNITSRVEGCTKDHPYPVLATRSVIEKAQQELGTRAHRRMKPFFHSIGLHNLRGLDEAVELFRCEKKFHQRIAKVSGRSS